MEHTGVTPAGAISAPDLADVVLPTGARVVRQPAGRAEESGTSKVGSDDPDAKRSLFARVGGDGEGRVRQARRARGVDRLTAREDERHARFGRLHDPSLRRNYPVQVPRVGGAAASRPGHPLSPAVPSSPRVEMDRIP